MPRARKPLAVAKLDGSYQKNKKRFAGRNSQLSTGELGDPPDWLPESAECKARTAWFTFALEAEWLDYSHRSIVEVASLIRGELMAGGMPGIQRLNLLKQCLQQIGATPATASKVSPPAEEPPDPDEAYFE